MKVFDRLVAGTLFVAAGIVLMNIERFDSHKAYAQQNSPTPATIMSGSQTPTAAGILCGPGQASTSSASLYNQTGVSGNSIWKCATNDGTTYAWQAPFVAATPTILGSTASFGGAALLLGGNVTADAAVAGATVGSNCVATRADGTFLAVGLIIDCKVNTAGIATVRISAVLAGTPTAGVYNVRVIN
jgi:hypothetical protein